MSRREDRVGLQDMLSHAREAAELLGNAGREELGRDRVRQLALTRLVESSTRRLRPVSFPVKM